MTGNEDLYETLMRELDDVVVCDSGEIQQQHEDFLFNEETVSDDFPPSLLSYFETSKNRAAVCEKLILEDLEGFTASHQTDDVMIFSTERDKDKLNMQVSCETEKEEINTSSKTEKLFIHNVSTSVNSEDEADIDECVGCEEDVKGDDVKMKKNSEYQRNVREKRRCEETEKEEKQRREREFEEELKKLMEAEKRHQEELELMEKKAQEKLEQEFLLQQELISNLQRRVEEEKKMRDEEEERRRKEEERRKQEEEERRRKEERRKVEEEERRRKEEERRKVEEEERRRKEEERRKVEEEERRRKEEERRKVEEEERRRKEEERRKVEEEEKKKEEDEEKKRMKEEKKKQKEEEEKKREEEEQKRKEEEEKQERRMKEEKKMKEEERKREEEEKMERKQMEEEMKRKKDDEVKREKEGMRLKEKQKQQEEEEKKEEEETRQTDEEEEMMEVTKRKNEGGTRRKEDESNSDEEVKMKENEEEEKMMKRKEEINIKEDEEKEKKIKEEETRKLEEEKMRRQKKEEEIRIKKEKRLDEDEGKIQEEKDDVKRRNTDEEENIRIKTEEETNVNRFTTLQQGDGATVRSESTSNSFISPQSDHHHHLHPHHRQDSEPKTTNRPDEEVRPRLPLCLPENTEHKRLTWMKLCTSWSKLSLQNKNKVKTRGGGGGGGRGGGGRRKVDTLPPLCPNSLLQSTGCKSLQEVTSLTLEDSSSCNLSTLAQCFRLQSLTLRRCGLKSLDNINELQRLCYIDVQENSISSVDCENMKSLRVLRLGHNELRSIHGLNGAEHLDFLDVSHNNITRVAGLESTRRLQTLTVDHNQLISTRGLKDVYTLMHLDCSHNHLVNVEGLENNALLKTLDLRANNLTEPPSLSNHVLLTDLRLDNNSVSSLQGLSSCWLPLMRRLSAAQNRITHLPSMFDFVSLENLDLRFNCLSELQDVCQSLDGCLFLRQLHLVGNPLQQEKGWRSALQKTASGLRLIDGEETDSSPSSAVVQRVDSASGGFITFCQTQLTQTDDLQQQHSDELRKASSRLDEVKICCRHFNETLKLAIDHRFAHEYGEVAVSEGQTTTPDDDDSDPVKTFLTSDFHFFETTPESNLHNPESRKKASSHLDEVKLSVDHENDDVATSEGQTTPSSNHQNLESIKTTAAAAAVLIQQQWRKYRVKCLRNVSRSPPTEEEEGGETESGPSFINRSHVGQDQAATVIQALWRGFALRRRLASALAAVTSHDDEDETLEEVDVDEFIFDEEELERYCSLQLYDDSTSRRRSVKPLVEPSEHTLPPVHPQEAWPDPPRYKTSTHTFNGRGSSASDLSDVSTRTKQIMDEWGFTDSHTALQLLRRAQKMKPKMKKQPRQKHTNPCVRTDVFRNCSYQRKPAKAPNYSGYKKAVERGRSLRHHETQPIKPRLDDDDSESERFLPEISSDIQNGGRVQLVADPGYTEQLHHSGGSLAKTLAAQTCNQRHRNTRNDLLPSPQRVSSAPNRKERISFRDNAVRFSGGWGGGKKRSNDK